MTTSYVVQYTTNGDSGKYTDHRAPEYHEDDYNTLLDQSYPNTKNHTHKTKILKKGNG